ncbi:MAG: helix-turn-helix transcriptional regulator [Chitinophagales bacterium]
MEQENNRYRELGDFLKIRRTRVLPSQVGLPSGLRRRTPGLRREEVAQLAGISITWYTWLEQGRPIRVSTSIIESLARVLLLDDQERNHLYALAQQPAPVILPSCPVVVSPTIQHVLNNLVLCPAFVMDRRWNVVAWNRAAVLVFGDYAKMNVRERNIVWMMFTNPGYQQLFIDWALHAQGMLARFRSACDQYIEDPWITGFVSDLRRESEQFDLWWSHHDVQSNSEIQKKLNHPTVGTLVFEFCSLELSDHTGSLIVNTPQQEEETIEKMKSLLEQR